MEAMLDLQLSNKQETMTIEDNMVVVRKSLDAEALIRAIPHYAEIVNSERDRTGRLYYGSVDLLTAQNWAKECGSPIGRKEWLAYSKKKLMSGEFAKFRAPRPI